MTSVPVVMEVRCSIRLLMISSCPSRSSM